jgi:uncharacterized protein YceH (UPF0502 family)
MDLSNAEIRVLGCLLEKQRTTPDHYPLSLNSLRLACNQSTNREPVVQYDEAIIKDALHRLGRRGYVRLAGAARAAKYRHLLADALPMSEAEQAVMCVLMLRGPQTPGELKQRGERIHAFADLAEVQATLGGLIERELVARLDRRPGQKEERYAQLLSEEENPNGSPQAAPSGPYGAEANIVGPSGLPGTASSLPGAGGTLTSFADSVSAAGVDGADDSDAAVGVGSRGLEELRDRIERLEREVAELREVMLS